MMAIARYMYTESEIDLEYQNIVSKMNSFLHEVSVELAT